jgi:GNAT superfamily N-acetyltransferase
MHLLIRPAIAEEAPLLTALALRSKRLWGYDDDFMRNASSDLEIVPESFLTRQYFVLESESTMQGFYSLEPLHDGVELTHLFVVPEGVRHGFGRLLWDHAVNTARRAGYRRMKITSDPNAEGFYIAMGAVPIGAVESPVVPGRKLPVLEFRL